MSTPRAYRPSYRVREMFWSRWRVRQSRGPADGLLEEIQRDVLERHPDWHRALLIEEAKPIDRHSNKLFNRAGTGGGATDGRGRWKRDAKRAR